MKNKSSSPKKGIYFWLTAFSGLLLLVSLLALLSAGSELSSASSNLKSLKVQMPSLEEFVNVELIDFRNNSFNQRRLKASDIPKLADEAILPVSLNNAINRAFEYFSEFENKRAGSILVITSPTVDLVEEGSPAALAGIKSGDLVVSVNGVKVESAKGFYTALNDKPAPQLSMKVLRNKKENISVQLINPNNLKINATNSGVKFILPPEISYLTEQDAKNLANKYRNEMLPGLPIDWRVDAANNLMQSAKRLNLVSQKIIDPTRPSPIKLRATDVITWQHDRVLENIEAYFSSRRKIENNNLSYLSNLGDAVIGFVLSAIIFMIAAGIFWYQRRDQEKK